MININSVSSTPASRQLLMIRQIKTRIAECAERQCDHIMRGESAKDEEESTTLYKRLLTVLSKDYRDPFCRN